MSVNISYELSSFISSPAEVPFQISQLSECSFHSTFDHYGWWEWSRSVMVYVSRKTKTLSEGFPITYVWTRKRNLENFHKATWAEQRDKLAYRFRVFDKNFACSHLELIWIHVYTSTDDLEAKILLNIVINDNIRMLLLIFHHDNGNHWNWTVSQYGKKALSRT